MAEGQNKHLDGDTLVIDKLILAVDGLRVCVRDLVEEIAFNQGIAVLGYESMNEDIDELLEILQSRVDNRRYGKEDGGEHKT